MKLVAVIPARGGSKRIPRKNVLPFNGQPMISYPICAAQDSGLFDSIIVSTDDEEISNIAKSLGAKVPKLRSAELSDDFSTTYDVMQDVLTQNWIDGDLPQYVCCVYATTPMLSARHLIDSFNVINGSDFDYVFPAAPFPHPIERSFQVSSENGLKMLYPEHLLTRSQDLPKTFHDVGQFYWGKTEAWVKNKPIFSSRSQIIPVSHNEFVDIDTFEDFELVEKLVKLQADGKD